MQVRQLNVLRVSSSNYLGGRNFSVKANGPAIKGVCVAERVKAGHRKAESG